MSKVEKSHSINCERIAIANLVCLVFNNRSWCEIQANLYMYL